MPERGLGSMQGKNTAKQNMFSAMCKKDKGVLYLRRRRGQKSFVMGVNTFMGGEAEAKRKGGGGLNFHGGG